MDSFAHRRQSGFCYDPEPGSMVDSTADPGFLAILEIHIHHARNIHNICIYNNQDVYAKFSLTYNPDETLSTTIVEGGGKNPDFDQRLSIKVNQPDSVLKCEMWMLSRARNYMEDQLLGFALVPLSEIAGKGKVTADYSLSSTDLFHSPAGTVRLSLSLDATTLPVDPLPGSMSSITSEVVLLDRETSELDLDPVEYSRIEFPDISVVAENQQMVSKYFTSSSRNNPNGIASFLHLGSCPIDRHPLFEYEIAGDSPDNNSACLDAIGQNPGFLNSTTTSISDEGNSSDSIKNKGHLESHGTLISPNPGANHCSKPRLPDPDTPTSKKLNDARVEEGSRNAKESDSPDRKIDPASSNSFEQVFPANLEAEQSAMQQQIVGMYMRSMQQFTESLAKMELPMDLGKLDREEKPELDQTKKDGSRVFYGSRAFF